MDNVIYAMLLMMTLFLLVHIFNTLYRDNKNLKEQVADLEQWH
jgi:hypothetical protein